MYKMVLVLKFRPDMDPQEVRKWWRNPQGALEHVMRWDGQPDVRTEAA